MTKNHRQCTRECELLGTILRDVLLSSGQSSRVGVERLTQELASRQQRRQTHSYPMRGQTSNKCSRLQNSACGLRSHFLHAIPVKSRLLKTRNREELKDHFTSSVCIIYGFSVENNKLCPAATDAN